MQKTNRAWGRVFCSRKLALLELEFSASINCMSFYSSKPLIQLISSRRKSSLLPFQFLINCNSIANSDTRWRKTPPLHPRIMGRMEGTPSWIPIKGAIAYLACKQADDEIVTLSKTSRKRGENRARWQLIIVGTSSPIFCTIKMYEGLTPRTTVQIGEILEPIGNVNSRNQGLTEIPAENKNDLFSSLIWP